jgi:tagatose-1,6-bisphosphate aldolase
LVPKVVIPRGDTGDKCPVSLIQVNAPYGMRKNIASDGLGGGLTVSSSNQDIMRGMNRKRSKSRGANLDKSLRLTTEQKCDIAQKELDELKEEIEKYRIVPP